MTRIGAIDQGTTSTRILVEDGDTLTIAASHKHTTRYPHPGWVEQDPLELLTNIRACIAAAGPLDALGLANQGESCLAWDALTGEPLTPVIVWQDNRTAADLAALDPATAARITALSGLPTDAYFSASKLGWIMRNVPAAREAHAKGRLRLGTTDAYFLDRLASRFATDRATASRTSLMNMATGEWDAELCAIFGVPIECLPPILPNIADFGAVDGVPVRASIVDQQAALYGHGCRHPGDAKITFGTGAFAIGISNGKVPPDRAGGLLPTIAWDLGTGPVYALDGGVYDVGSAIDWAIRAGLATSVADFQQFDAPPAIERGLVFVPAFSGLAAPDWDRTAAPLIIGLTTDMTSRDICQAMLEGIALSTAAVFDAMRIAIPLGATISIDGGVSQSPYFAQFLADCLGVRVVARAFADRTALGAAQLVATALGAPPPIAATHEDRTYDPKPRPGLTARFARARALARGWRT
jgi:glycerol kinase